MIHARVSGCTHQLKKTEYSTLFARVIPSEDGKIQFVTTAWEPTPEELAQLVAGGKVHITIIASRPTHPPIKVSVE